MAYRRTARVQARIAGTRERIVMAAAQLVTDGGWSAASMKAVAVEAGVATGTLYRYVEDRDQLVAEVFRRAAGRELMQIRKVAESSGPPLERLESALRTFADRSIRSRRLAYSLLAEPAGQAVERERLAFRISYRSMFEELLEEAQAAGDLEKHDAALVAAVLTGAMSEMLVGPIAPVGDGPAGGDTAQVDDVVTACLRALPRSATGQAAQQVTAAGSSLKGRDHAT